MMYAPILAGAANSTLGSGITGSGVLTAQDATVSGAGTNTYLASGALAAQAATVAGAGVNSYPGTGALAATDAIISGTGVNTYTGSGALVAQDATIHGYETLSPGSSDLLLVNMGS